MPPSDATAKRTVEALHAALQAAPEKIAKHADTIAAAGIDGHLALLLTSGDMVELLPGAPIGERLGVLHSLHDLAVEPHKLYIHKNRKKMGEDLVMLAMSQPDVRSKLLINCESVMLLSGLLSTIAAGALLTPQCDVSDPDNIVCSPLQMADTIVWGFVTATLLLSVMCAVCTATCVNLLDDEQLRTWGILNFRKVQQGFQLLGGAFGMWIPLGLSLRMWSVTTPLVGGILIAIFFLVNNVYFFTV